MADAELGRQSLNGSRIRSLLDKISAEYIIVLIDGCHAEAVATSIGLPVNLHAGKGRLIIASARADQRSWEDDSLQRSLFSDVVLRGLSLGSPIADLSGRVDVEARLVPYLREQVPLEAATRKGRQAQEPVSGGWMAQPLMLPTIEARSLGRPLTTVETIRAGIRRALFGLAGVVVVSLLALDSLAFHLAVTTTGQLVVRPSRAASHSEKDTDAKISEFVAFADAIVLLSKAAMPNAVLHSNISEAFKNSQKTWCGVHAAFARAALGEALDSHAAEDEFREMLATRDPAGGALHKSAPHSRNRHQMPARPAGSARISTAARRVRIGHSRGDSNESEFPGRHGIILHGTGV